MNGFGVSAAATPDTLLMIASFFCGLVHVQ
jgi:hypothetical protein